MNKAKIVKQMEFCRMLSDNLAEAVFLHEHCRCIKGTTHHSNLHEYREGIKEAGATKTQIQASIVQLRRELNALSRMLECTESSRV